MPERWLILADDLTGAADTAIAFARAGWAASVAWGAAAPEDAVLSFDADSRRLTGAEAAARHAALLRAHGGGRSALFKKIDSTLRGHPAAELAGVLHALRGQGHRALAVVAAAFPALGRTTVAGCIHLNGQPLEVSPLWAREHSYPTADLCAVLAGEGLRTRHAPLGLVRDGAGALARLLHDALADGTDAVVCDAVLEEDLARIVRAGRPLARALLWVGSAGLARALAGAVSDGAMAPSRAAGGILTVVGSLAEASRAGVALLADDPGLLTLTIAPATLRGGPRGPDWRAQAAAAVAALAAGRDVLVAIQADPGTTPAAGALLADRLGLLLAPASSLAGALVVTGGETARAVCDAFGIAGIRMLAEIEPGVPLGLAHATRALPIITKAGGFGDAGTLSRCLAHLRRLPISESPA
ncbi:uncharacterized protein YgbK (DUF1537 family) [Humitalea rosea]|uniref:Uncharacterized protein YgbK (DUF1537 family) n=1 Tax=Humitalea rosea TaxID=990373 RepID=A0A2W7IML4_9PROT|nr:four-carbon acid sugar kinase family protein [Humitalea rosea]PZW48075.1 uncharacterized protein YgbK (DUF1537 family) [Humitalea rosea]